MEVSYISVLFQVSLFSCRIGSETRDKGPGKNKINSPGPGSYGLPSLVSLANMLIK